MFGPGTITPCPMEADQDSSYEARLDPTPRLEVNDYVPAFIPVGCCKATGGPVPAGDHDGDARERTNGSADVDSDGRQRIRLRFEMSGAWQGEVIVMRPWRPPVAVPMFHPTCCRPPIATGSGTAPKPGGIGPAPASRMHTLMSNALTWAEVVGFGEHCSQAGALRCGQILENVAQRSDPFSGPIGVLQVRQLEFQLACWART